MPQASYGYQGLGMPPTRLQQLRVMAAQASGKWRMGMCTTTLLAVLAGRRDPAYTIPEQAVRSWFDLLTAGPMMGPCWLLLGEDLSSQQTNASARCRMQASLSKR